MSTLSLSEVKAVVKELLKRYHAESALLFGSYARGDATPESDIDIISVGGKDFGPRNIFALAEDCLLYTSVPVRLYELAVSLQADLTAGITGFGTTNIGDAAKAALENFCLLYTSRCV